METCVITAFSGQASVMVLGGNCMCSQEVGEVAVPNEVFALP